MLVFFFLSVPFTGTKILVPLPPGDLVKVFLRGLPVCLDTDSPFRFCFLFSNRQRFPPQRKFFSLAPICFVRSFSFSPPFPGCAAPVTRGPPPALGVISPHTLVFPNKKLPAKTLLLPVPLFFTAPQKNCSSFFAQPLLLFLALVETSDLRLVLC